jgi:hypothetical protein
MDTKRCPRCETAKPVSEYHRNRRNSDGLTAYCKPCTVDLAAEQRARAVAARKDTDTKHCTKCNAAKLVSEFHKDGRSRDGLCSYCKECNKARVRKWAQDNPEKARAQAQKRQELGLNRAQIRFRKYGIGATEYAALLASQGEACAICKRTASGRKDSTELCVDHCHTSNDIRGLLCHSCNRALGLFQDSPEILEEAAAYLRTRRSRRSSQSG